jgi:tetrachlorobenzoquinone reductase
MAGTMIEVTVHARCVEAQGVVSLELRPRPGQPALPAFSAGGHIDVEVPQTGGTSLLRQYSLCNDPAESQRYVIGVGRDPSSRGGSAALCDRIVAGDTLRISAPRNHFALVEQAEDSILVAGGIGITPLLAMARRLSQLGRRWTLYLCARTPQRAAFLAEVQRLPGVVVPVFDGLPGEVPLDLGGVVAIAPPQAHLYCCGPEPMMRAFEQACAGRDPSTVHVEWFRPPTPPAGQAGQDKAFTVHLQRSGRSLVVPVGQSMLDVLLAAGIDVPHSCCDGVCGTCETRVLAGRPDHRDAVLLGDDAQAQDRLMVCVSRCLDADMTLDL